MFRTILVPLKLDMHHNWLHCTIACEACLVYLFAFFGVSLSVDCGTGVEIDYTVVPYSYPAEQGKRSPIF